MGKKIKFPRNLCVLRKGRLYLHSTDIFLQIVKTKKTFFLENININFKKKIINQPFLELYKRPMEKKNNICCVSFKFKTSKNFNYGYIFQGRQKITNLKHYDEIKFYKKIKIFKNRINIPNINNYNFIEKITLSSMKFLKKVSPEIKKKWYLVQLNLEKFSKKKNYQNLFLVSKKKNNALQLMQIFFQNRYLGYMVFFKK